MLVKVAILGIILFSLVGIIANVYQMIFLRNTSKQVKEKLGDLDFAIHQTVETVETEEENKDEK